MLKLLYSTKIINFAKHGVWLGGCDVSVVIGELMFESKGLGF